MKSILVTMVLAAGWWAAAAAHAAPLRPAELPPEYAALIQPAPSGALPELPPLPPPARSVRLVWDKVPLPVDLRVGTERLMTFPEPIRLGLPAGLTAAQLRVQIIGSTAYLLAQQPFGPARVQVQALESNQTYLVDLTATRHAVASLPVEVFAPAAPAAAPVSAPAPPAEAPQQDYVTLTQMAATHLYAPERLLQTPDGVYRTAVRGVPGVELLRGAAVEATPVIGWRSGDLYVTAVKLVNRTALDLVLDPRTVRGDWLACTFHHARLFAGGDARDTSAAYLISARPFEEALHAR